MTMDNETHQTENNEHVSVQELQALYNVWQGGGMTWTQYRSLAFGDTAEQASEAMKEVLNERKLFRG